MYSSSAWLTLGLAGIASGMMSEEFGGSEIGPDAAGSRADPAVRTAVPPRRHETGDVSHRVSDETDRGQANWATQSSILTGLLASALSPRDNTCSEFKTTVATESIVPEHT